MIRRMWTLLLCMLFVFSFSCEKPKAEKCTTPEDNPQHHYLRGMDALEQGRLDVAKEKFERALYCEDSFYPAQGGLAIISAHKVKTQKDAGYSKVDRQRAIDYVEKGGKKAESDEDKFDHYLSVIRVDTIMDGKDWVKKV